MAEHSVTDHLQRWSEDPKANLDSIFPWVSSELRRMAGAFIDREAPEHTLQATALVNELYLRLLERREVAWNDRSHFFGFAARTLHRILVDHARAREAQKRGSGWAKLPWNESLDGEPALVGGLGGRQGGIDLPALDDALTELEAMDPRLFQIVELRFFTGLGMAEIAEVLGVGTATVQRGWATARAWLHRELGP